MLPFLFVVLGLSQPASADPIFRIEVGKDYQQYSDNDLRRRVWELERAVAQLQARVFQLEATPRGTTIITPVQAESWLCTISAMGKESSGTGATKAVAAHKAIEECKKTGDSFFCKNPQCSQ